MDAQADLHLCCSHMAKTGFLMTWLNYYYVFMEKYEKLSLNYHNTHHISVSPVNQQKHDLYRNDGCVMKAMDLLRK